MPGFDRVQDQLIAQTQIATATAALQNATAALQAQQEQLAIFLASTKKKPSIFAQGSSYDAVNSYTPNQSGQAADFWSDGGSTTVKVFNIEDADVARITVQFNTSNFSSLPLPLAYIGYVLSVQTVFNQVPISEAALFGNVSNTNVITAGGVALQYQLFREDIPCAGYKYLHLFGFLEGLGEDGDLWENIEDNSTSPGLMTFALIK